MSAGHNDPFHHVRDSQIFELPAFLQSILGGNPSLPTINLGFYQFPITKFMVLQVVAGLLTWWIFSSLAKSIAGGKPARGGWANFWEMIALYLRDNVVRPTFGEGGHAHHDHHHGHSGHGHSGQGHAAASHAHSQAGHDGAHDDHGHGDHGHTGLAHGGALAVKVGHPADQYLPFIWSCFFYILFCNLLGAIPFLGSPTGNISVTAVLAVFAFGMTLLVGTRELGVAGFWSNMIPPLDVPGPMKIMLVPLIAVIEVFGLFIKHGVLAVRLFANILGGHTVIAVMLGFIASVAHSWVWFIVTPASVAGQIGIGLLELFVAFLQAYVFSFLATIFISMGAHPHH